MDEGTLLEGLTASSGIPFLHWYLEYLVKSFDLRCAFVGELCGPDLETIRSLCVQAPGGLAPNFEYDLSKTPCQEVLNHSACSYPRRVQELFPEDHLLREMGIESYLGLPLHDKTSRPLGLVVLLDDKPMSGDMTSLARETLVLLQPRCAAVLEHRRLLTDMERILEAERTDDADRLGKLAEALARAMNVKVGFVVRIQPGDRSRFEALALSVAGDARGPGERSRVGTPFEDLGEEESFFFESGLRERFPEDEFLEELGAESMYGRQFSDPDGNPLGYVGVISDRPMDPRIDSQPLFRFFSKRIAAELRRRQDSEGRREAEKRLHAVQRMESLGVLAGGIAHDFNNLLTAVLGNAELARECVEGQEPASTHLSEIERASHKAGDLCRQMLVYSGKSQLERRSLSLNTMITEISSLLEVSLSKKCRLEVDLEEGLPPIEGDSAGLQQVILNLIQNAADSLEARAGRVRVGTDRIYLKDEDLATLILGDGMAPGPHQILQVEDDGTGMPPAVQHRIFDPFFTTKAEGHGLGLAAILGILKGHRAGASVESWPGRGTRFKVYIPSEKANPRVKEESFMPDAKPSARSRILIVDDEASVRGVALQVLKLAGHDVQTAENGCEALELIDAGESYELLLLDVSMPRMDGMELVRELEHRGVDTPVLLMSGHAAQELPESGAEGLIRGIVSKPFGIQDLRNAVAGILG